MKSKFIFIFAAIMTAQISQATVSINIQLGGFQNETGTPTSGMSYGFLVDTNSDGFTLGDYNSFDISLNGQFLSVSSDVSDDWFVYDGSLGAGQVPPTTSAFGPLGDDGAILSSTNISEENLSAGMEFLVVWFPLTNANLGSPYGAAGDGGQNMIIPSSGGASIAPESVSTKLASYELNAVPEPSTYAAIAGVLVLGFTAFRRRRA